MELLVKTAVDLSYSKFQKNPGSLNDLVDQVAYILLEVHELYWKEKMLLTLGYKAYKTEIRTGNTPSFQYYLHHLKNTFKNEHTNIWYNNTKSRSHQKALALYFSGYVRPSPPQRHSTYVKVDRKTKRKEEPVSDYSVLKFYVAAGLFGLAGCFFFAYLDTLKDKKNAMASEKDKQNTDSKPFNQLKKRPDNLGDGKGGERSLISCNHDGCQPVIPAVIVINTVNHLAQQQSTPVNLDQERQQREEARRRRDEEEAQRRRDEEEAQRRRDEEEAQRRRDEEEAQRRRDEEEAQHRRDEEDAWVNNGCSEGDIYDELIS